MLRRVVRAQLAECGVSGADTLLVALSGGRDSVALLHTLCALQKERAVAGVVAAHLHHGIRGEEADADARFVEQLCADWDVPLQLERADVPALARELHQPVEQAAREARYAFLHRVRVACGASYNIVAHHMEDQAETVLLHLLRGSGLAGLQGMRVQSGVLLRPLLHTHRADIEQYITEHALPFREDGSNADPAYLRNRVRLELLPLLEREYNPGIVEGLSRMAALLGQDEAYLREEAAFRLVRATLPAEGQGYDAYAIPKLAGLPAPIRSRALRLALEKAGALYGLQQGGLRSVDALLQARTGACRALPNGLHAWVSYDTLRIGTLPQVGEAAAVPFLQQGETPTSMGSFQAARATALRRDEGPFVAYMDVDKLPAGVVARRRQPGDRFHPLGAPGRRKLKAYLIDKKIPRHMRELPLLADGQDVYFFPGGTVSERVKVDEDTTRILRVVYVPEDRQCTDIQNRKKSIMKRG